ncbi:hypothetical protein G3A43_07965 [Paraburkholderia aspalathi]|nr:hypothetical protein [Paraburkholderia aspalathi]MBK3780191.1 hypothetical protein [Paraburkholderia aspalathi]
MNSETAMVLEGLQLERCRSDVVRARILGALIDFAREVEDNDLATEAQALMPKAHPFDPPAEWKGSYLGGLRSVADEDCGVYVDSDGERFARECWQGLTDEQRAARLHDPELGNQDGITDGDSLNGDC